MPKSATGAIKSAWRTGISAKRRWRAVIGPRGLAANLVSAHKQADMLRFRFIAEIAHIFFSESKSSPRAGQRDIDGRSAHGRHLVEMQVTTTNKLGCAHRHGNGTVCEDCLWAILARRFLQEDSYRIGARIADAVGPHGAAAMAVALRRSGEMLKGRAAFACVEASDILRGVVLDRWPQA